MVIYGMQFDDDDLLYRGIENQSSPAYSSLYLSIFFFPSILSRVKIFVKDFSATMQARMVIYMVCRLMMTYCIFGLRTSLLLLILPCICLAVFDIL